MFSVYAVDNYSSNAKEGTTVGMHNYQPVANGLRTDHPIPDLPFVDDSHIPVEDRDGVESIGRSVSQDMWGRTDRCHGGVGLPSPPTRSDGTSRGWCASTPSTAAPSCSTATTTWPRCT
jgi:hypothetical protein